MMTEVVKLSAEDVEIEKITAAAKVLDRGGLVAFPTETVYGIGCRAEPASIARLNEVKARSEGKRYTLHIACRETLNGYVPAIPLRAAKLIEKAWPGPLTLVFELDDKAIEKQRVAVDGDAFDVLYEDNTIGIRYPDNAIAQSLLALATRPIVAPSANLADRPAATSAAEVLAQFDGKIDVLLDGGRCKHKKSSTVVKVTAGRLTLLREGAYSENDVTEMASIRILFVCTGNTCRSPMAQAFCRKFISEKLDCDIDEVEQKGYKVGSAGVAAPAGMHASGEVVDICARKGIDVTGHRTGVLTRGHLEESDYVFAMTKNHRDRILELWPAVATKCMLLDDTGDIADPIGGGDDVYRRCAERIEKALEKILGGILV